MNNSKALVRSAGLFLFYCELWMAVPFGLLRAQKVSAPATQQREQTTVLRTSARLVMVDVVVRDRSNRPVRGLAASDFSISENGKEQNVRSFEEHVLSSSGPVANSVAMPPGDFTNYFPVDSGSSLNVILLDSLNTRLEDQAYARQQAIAYLKKKIQPGTRTAVFGLTTKLLMLQGFTEDPEALRIALSKKANATDSPLLEPSAASSTTPDSDEINYAHSAGVEGANAQEFRSFTDSFRTQMRVGCTLDALNLLGRYLAELPGRKNLIWFSGGFPINVLPEDDPSRDADPFAGVAGMEDEFRQTTDLLSRARVAVYPVDARGLVGFTDIAGSGPLMSRKGEQMQFANLAESHITMNKLADETGGKAFYNTNSLSDAAASAIDDGADYYTIAYTPSDPKDDGRFRNIHVSVGKPNLTLHYRRGYYADLAKPSTAAISSDSGGPSDPDLRLAMMHGAPDLSDVIFRIAVAPTSAPVHDESKIHGLQDASFKGPFRTYQIHFAVDATRLGFARAEDHFQPKIRFVAFLYDKDGRLLQGTVQAPSSSLTTEQIHTILQRGMQFPMEVDVPEKGDVFLRIGVEDELKHRVGSLEIPMTSVKGLTAVSPLANSQGAASDSK